MKVENRRPDYWIVRVPVPWSPTETPTHFEINKIRLRRRNAAPCRFEVKIEDLLAVPQRLRAAGVAAMGGRHEPIDEPVVFSWMPAASVFFDDPDSNLLEYIAMLDDEPQPELGLLLSWSEWLSGRKKAK